MQQGLGSPLMGCPNLPAVGRACVSACVHAHRGAGPAGWPVWTRPFCGRPADMEPCGQTQALCAKPPPDCSLQAKRSGVGDGRSPSSRDLERCFQALRLIETPQELSMQQTPTNTCWWPAPQQELKLGRQGLPKCQALLAELNSFHPTNVHSHFTDEKKGGQRGSVMSLRSHSQEEGGWDSDWATGSRVFTLNQEAPLPLPGVATFPRP